MTQLHLSQAKAPAPSLSELIAAFTYIGFLSFGGPAGQISLMHRIVVDEKRWLDHDRFMSALNYCMLLPGPEAQQLATYIGWLLHGKRGGMIAGALFILPGLLCIFALASAYALLADATWVTASLVGLKGAVLAVIIQALINIGKKALVSPVHHAIAIAAFLALFVFAVPFPIVVFTAGLIGVGMANKSHRKIIPTALPDAEKARASLRLKSLAVTALIGILLWQVPLILALIPVVPSILPELHLFFSKMALVTFGGAYAVLSYVAQVFVETKAWVSASEMLDGLAFAEATPGPLVLVLPFISFLAGFDHSGSWSPFAVALTAGLITTWATFVPSFLFIFLGAPFVERINHMPLAKAAMSAITAAIVGVIANLTLWFAIGILFEKSNRVPLGILPFGSLPVPDLATLDLVSLGVVVLSFGLLYWLRFSVLATLSIGLCIGILKMLLLG